jgi:hypothetical protein
MVGRRVALGFGCALVLALSVGAASAGDALTVQGALLSQVKVTPSSAVVARTVDLVAGEVVTATFVTMRTPDGKYLQRNADGYWLPWGGARDALINNGFQAAGSALTFKVLKQDISSLSFPLTVSIAYQSSAGFKFGVFEVLPQ